MIAELHNLRSDVLRACELYPRLIDRFYYFSDFGFFVIANYRIQTALRNSVFKYFGIHVLLERLMSFFAGVHLPAKTQIGPGMIIHHGYGIVINSMVVIGSNATIYHRVTLGARFAGDSSPLAGDYVTFGCGCTVLGPVIIDDRSTVPAGSLLKPEKLSQ